LNLSGWRERGFYGRAHRNKDDTKTLQDVYSVPCRIGRGSFVLESDQGE